MTVKEYQRFKIFISVHSPKPRPIWSGSILMHDTYAKKYLTHTFVSIENLDRLLKYEGFVYAGYARKEQKLPYKHIKSINLYIGDAYF